MYYHTEGSNELGRVLCAFNSSSSSIGHSVGKAKDWETGDSRAALIGSGDMVGPGLHQASAHILKSPFGKAPDSASNRNPKCMGPVAGHQVSQGNAAE